MVYLAQMCVNLLQKSSMRSTPGSMPQAHPYLCKGLWYKILDSDGKYSDTTTILLMTLIKATLLIITILKILNMGGITYN